MKSRRLGTPCTKTAGARALKSPLVKRQAAPLLRRLRQIGYATGVTSLPRRLPNALKWLKTPPL